MANKRQQKKNAKKTKSLFDFDKWEVQQRAKQEEIQKEIRRHIEQANRELTRLAQSLPVKEGKRFEFQKNPGYIRRSNQITKDLERRITASIQKGMKIQWDFANRKNDAYADAIQSTGSLAKKVIDSYKGQNTDQLNKILKQRIAGLKLQERAKVYAQQFKQEFEVAFSLVADDKRNVQRLARDINQFLDNPSRMRSRFKLQYGTEQMKTASKVFSPGRGIYRSTYGNLNRLVRTELRNAYTEADNLRLKSTDFIVGYSVKRSSPNAVPCIVCDSMTGRFPKTYKFVQRHPQCQCICTPILASKEDLMRLNRMASRSEDISTFTASNEITEYPEGFYTWIEDNKQKLLTSTNVPKFLKDNIPGNKALKFLKGK